jgi:hypothetical protein
MQEARITIFGASRGRLCVDDEPPWGSTVDLGAWLYPVEYNE